MATLQQQFAAKFLRRVPLRSGLTRHSLRCNCPPAALGGLLRVTILAPELGEALAPGRALPWYNQLSFQGT